MSNFNGIPYDNVISIGKANFMMDRRNCSLQNDGLFWKISLMPDLSYPEHQSFFLLDDEDDSVLYAGQQILGMHY